MIDNRFYKNNGPFSLKQIAEICNAELVDDGKSNVMINDLASIYKGGAGEISFFFALSRDFSIPFSIHSECSSTIFFIRDFLVPMGARTTSFSSLITREIVFLFEYIIS